MIKKLKTAIQRPEVTTKVLARSLSYFLSKYDHFRQVSLSLLPFRSDPLPTLFRATSATCFLEVGVGTGRTLRKYLSEAEKMGIPHVKYVGFDTFGEGPPNDEVDDMGAPEDKTGGDYGWELHHTEMEKIEEIPKEYGVDAEVDLYKGRTEKTLPRALPELSSADVVYIDGGHAYGTVKNDFMHIREWIDPGAAIVLDDFRCEPGVTKFVAELLQTEGDWERFFLTPGFGHTEPCLHAVFIY